MSIEQLIKAALKEAQFAYQFGGNSYSYGAMNSCALAVEIIERSAGHCAAAAEGFCQPPPPTGRAA
jgi:hypothetical protein